jgi:hypothetical protein
MWTLLSVLAACTKTVRVLPNVANLPLRPPAITPVDTSSFECDALADLKDLSFRNYLQFSDSQFCNYTFLSFLRWCWSRPSRAPAGGRYLGSDFPPLGWWPSERALAPGNIRSPCAAQARGIPATKKCPL